MVRVWGGCRCWALLFARVGAVVGRRRGGEVGRRRCDPAFQDAAREGGVDGRPASWRSNPRPRTILGPGATTTWPARKRPSRPSPAPNHHGLSTRAWCPGPACRGQARRQPLGVRTGTPALPPELPHSHRGPRTWSRFLLLGRIPALRPSESASETVQPQTSGSTAGARSNRRQAVQLGAGGSNPWTRGRPRAPGSSTPCLRHLGRGGKHAGAGRRSTGTRSGQWRQVRQEWHDRTARGASFRAWFFGRNTCCRKAPRAPTNDTSTFPHHPNDPTPRPQP